MKKLYRLRNERVIAGVAGGLGRYLDIDPILVRLFFVLLVLSDGIGVMLYVILAFVIPEAPQGMEEMSVDRTAGTELRETRTRTVLGAGLLLFGLFFLLQTFDVPFATWLRLNDLWPLLLVAAGGVLIWRQYQEQHQGG
jgi:phage shock protein C